MSVFGKSCLRSAGFSLVELSIVLVILGLLVGGVLSGQSLIKAAELRQTGEQIGKLNTAFLSFKDKYFCLPGDCNNASSFGYVAVTTLGPNGDGSGSIDVNNEVFVAQGILAQAQLLDGTETNKGYSGRGVALRPKVTSIGSDGYQGYWWAHQMTTATNLSTPAGGNYYWSTTSGVTGARPGIFATYDSYNIDTKYDDGKPRSGSIMAAGYGSVSVSGFRLLPTFVLATDATAAAGSGNPQCITSALEYNVLNTNKSICSITVKSAF